MNKLLLIASLALIAGSFFILNQGSEAPVTMENDYASQFAQFKANFNKKYASYTEDSYRLMVYTYNIIEAETHNTNPESTWVMGETQFSDLTQNEFAAMYLTTIPQQEEQTGELYDDADFVPNGAVDWRGQSGVSTKVKNQGQCGSCWAFSVVSAVEAYYATVKGQKNLDLSEQQLVDCSTGDSGCNGGWPANTLSYVAKNGLTTESAYPYTARGGSCKTNSGSYKISGPKGIAATQAAHQSALTQRPFSVCVDASNWSQYRSGVLSTCGKSINHAVAAFGYDASNNWIIKNSWGTSWGENGYIRLAPGNTCNVLGASNFAA